jgi:2-methylisocitrate lyase-like PEP mutase family enzyme
MTDEQREREWDEVKRSGSTMSRHEFLKLTGAGAIAAGLMSSTGLAQINRLPPGTHPSNGKKLRAMLARKGQPCFVAHAIDGMSAKLMADAGYEASFIGTSGVQGRWTNLADRGLTDVGESITIFKYMVDAAPDYPMILDGDTGHGGPDMVKRLVQECIKIGLAGIRIDDQEIEKKRTTGNSGIDVVSREMAIARYKAASDARNEMEPDFVIEAQMYTREAANGGMAEALARIPMYEAAGCDWVNLTRAQSVDEMKKGRAAGKKFFGGMNGAWAKGFLTVKAYGDLGLNSIWGAGPGADVDKVVDKALAEYKKRGPEFVTESLGTVTRTSAGEEETR